MKRLKFILAVESYLIRKGIGVVLKNIPGNYIIKEVDTVLQLDQYLKRNNPDFIIICDSIFSKVTSIYLENSLLVEKTILINKDHSTDLSQGIKESISLNDTEDLIQLKIERLLEPYYKNHQDPAQPELSDREKTIVQFAAKGFTNKEIAEKLFLSTHTVITHRKNISRKLGIKSVSGLTVYAIVNNIINIEEITGMKKTDQ